VTRRNAASAEALKRALVAADSSGDQGRMSGRHSLLVVAVTGLCLAASADGFGVGAPAATRAQAERNVLRALERGWGRRRIPALFNPRTHLLRNNTQAVCRGAHGSSRRFICVVRPARHRPRQGLYISYRTLRHGQFRLRWLFYRRG
jgi:hypothetical protein